MLTFKDHELGHTADAVQVTTRAANRRAVTSMAQQCRQHLVIISRDLDPPLYDTVEFIEASKKMVLANRRASIRILVFEPQAIIQRGHRLVNLAMQLSSFFEFRAVGPEYKDFNEALFIADATGYLHRLNSERYEGTVNFNDHRISNYLLQQFEEIWEKASPDMNLKKLHL
ncbi:MAG: hypothetical protein ACE5GZ_02105 [Gammaproteobacteria bacterium]